MVTPRQRRLPEVTHDMRELGWKHDLDDCKQILM
jgi:hypothetical protein